MNGSLVFNNFLKTRTFEKVCLFTPRAVFKFIVLFWVLAFEKLNELTFTS